MSRLIAAAIAACLGLVLPSSTWAWGPAGHAKVCLSALELLSKRRHPLAQFLSANAPLLKELSVLPDSQGKARSPQEEPLHRFEVDAFMSAPKSPSSISLLPKGEYREVRQTYWTLLNSNAEKVRAAIPGQPLLPELRGTAPWRVLQLHRLAVASLKAGDPGSALRALAGVGHHVADLSEPLETAMPRLGGHPAAPVHGAQLAFETFVAGAASEREVRSQAETLLGGKALKPVAQTALLTELFSLVQSGYPLIEPMLAAFSQKCLANREGFPGACAPAAGSGPVFIPDPVASGLSRAALDIPEGRTSRKTTAVQAVEKRMAEASALLARLWASAYLEAGSPDLSRRFVTAEDPGLGKAYPDPDYLPDPGAAPTDPGPLPPETITPVASIMADTRGHDDKVLCAAGKVSVLFQKTSRKGNSYFTFFLSDGPAKVKVFSFGRPTVKEGEEVEACGRFSYEKRVSGRLFFNQVSAERILKGPAMRSGAVQLTPDGVLPVKD
ncbi:MAG: hypothetical protein HY924_10250 [Elusimicrobia bacterium]|nr:hypothetical protein [Elusimicrobiota bacterium]